VRVAVTTRINEPLDIVDVPDPTPGPGELVLAVEACGICGSDLHLHGALDIPDMTLGHEFCGQVVGVGSDVEGWSEGQRAVGLSLATCGTCDACKAGLVRKCTAAQMIGVERQGAFAEQLTIPAHNALAIPAGFSADLGALVEPLAVARHAVERAGAVKGQHTLVLGAGPVGLAVALWLRHEGAASVTVSDPAVERREQAKGYGIDAAFDPTLGDLAEAVAAEVGAAPSVVVECVGLPGLIESGSAVAATDGRVVVVGVCFSEDTIVPLTAMSKELDISYAFYYRQQDMEATLRALHEGTLDASAMVTGHVSLDELPDRFQALKSPSTDVKVMITP
jgi:(R,R)-butanediol dehydrogenase/meso-butanediol dehydrogenase/diacetyl reductase